MKNSFAKLHAFSRQNDSPRKQSEVKVLIWNKLLNWSYMEEYIQFQLKNLPIFIEVKFLKVFQINKIIYYSFILF